MSAPLISVEKVFKAYRRGAMEIPVLANVDLAIAAGEFIALMGPSGSGKSTLLNLIAGLDKPTKGVVRVAGRDISGLSESELATWRSQNVGLIFQLFHLIPVLTAYENVELPLYLTHLSRRRRHAQVRAVLAIVGLFDRMEHYPRQLSGGQEQRVAIARSLVTDPPILIADEPTGDLDAKSASEVLRLMARLNTEFRKTIVMVTHDPKAAAYAHRVLCLEKGALLAGDASALPTATSGPTVVPLPGSADEAAFKQGFTAAMAPVVTPPVANATETAMVFEGLTDEEIEELVFRLETLDQKASVSIVEPPNTRQVAIIGGPTRFASPKRRSDGR